MKIMAEGFGITDQEEAKIFVKKTGVDYLAIGVGTVRQVFQMSRSLPLILILQSYFY